MNAWRSCILMPLIAAPLLLSGCSSLEMKGTPFYTGEYGAPRGRVEDRIAVWPLLYYREPALSVLWPFGEKTDDHFAVRPLVSVYGLGQDRKIVSVLWPFAQFDFQENRHRIFPFFWGKDYACGFPLYWHIGQMDSAAGGLDTLFPLWWYSRDSGGFNAWFAGPLVHLRYRDKEYGWHAGPLAGSYGDDEDRYSFALWPLFHQWSSRANKAAGSALLPVYWQSRDAWGSRFLSLPYSAGRSVTAGEWELALPLFYRSRTPDESTFVSLLYSAGRSAHSDDRWSLLLPLFYRESSRDSRTVATLLGGYHADKDSSAWVAVPALSGGRRTATSGDTWVLGPMAHYGWTEKSSSSHILPLFYRQRSAEDSLFLSLPWSSSKTAAGSWELIPPLYYHTRAGERQAWITPLFSRGHSPEDNADWSTLLPLYYRRQAPDDRMLATLLGGFRTDAEGKRWLIYPLLSWGRRSGDTSDLWLLTPFFHSRSARGKVVEQHLLPLYYRSREPDTFLSLVAARWKDENGLENTLVPPLLSSYSTGPRASHLWALAGLGHFSWGPDAESDHILPLYYRNRKSDALVSPLYATWESDGWRRHIVPPLLSRYSKRGREKDLKILLGLGSDHWGDAVEREGYLFPLYYYRGGEQMYSLLFGWNRSQGDGFVYPLSPLLGFWTGEHSGGWLFPLFSQRRDRKTQDYAGNILWAYYRKYNRDCTHCWMFPLFSYRNHGTPELADTERIVSAVYGRSFWCLPLCWYENTAHVSPASPPPNPSTPPPPPEPATTNRLVVTRIRSNGVFPLWSYSKKSVAASDWLNTDSSVLLLLYDYKRRIEPDPAAPASAKDYARARILWRFWHYERNHDDVTVDVFPAITYDRRGDGFKKVSFLWRLFRYERKKDSRELDLLFVPLVRKGSSSP